MPRREDERQINLTGRHPVYCTCTVCAQQFLARKDSAGAMDFMRGLLGYRKQRPQEQVREHPQDCTCATCALLASVDTLPPLPRRKNGLIRRLLGKGYTR